MRLHADWRQIVRKAWSFRLILLAGLLSGLEVVLPQLEPTIPPRLFGLASFFVTCGALIARIVAQPKMEGDDQ